MKTLRPYRIIMLIITALVFSPILNYSIAQAMMADDHSQMQMESTTSDKCHEKSDNQQCKHCADTVNGQCNNTCEHGVSSVAMIMQTLDTNYYQQDKPATIKPLMHSIDPDAMLRPPRFA